MAALASALAGASPLSPRCGFPRPARGPSPARPLLTTTWVAFFSPPLDPVGNRYARPWSGSPFGVRSATTGSVDAPGLGRSADPTSCPACSGARLVTLDATRSRAPYTPTELVKRR